MRLKHLLMTAAILVGGVASAQAAPINFTDTFDPTDVLLDNASAVACLGTNGATDTVSAATCKSITYSHTLAGYNAATDTLSAGSLTVQLYDDADTPAEKFDYVIDLLLGNNVTVLSGSNSGNPFELTLNVLSQITDGVLNVTLTNQNGDFMFANSVLTASGDRGVAAVPEPAALLLVGGGLAGALARYRRRRLAL